MATHPINVLVVEDSPVERELLLHILHSDPQIGKVSVATNGEEAVEAACRERPDVVTMDIHMPKLDGVSATRRILERCPVPIVIISSSSAYGPEGEKSFLALEAGALALTQKPPGIGHSRHREEAEKLLQTVKLMSEVTVVRRRPRAPSTGQAPLPKAESPFPVKLVAIGASAGGPQALQFVLAGLPKTFPVPVLIVQHMASGFIQGFSAWLQDSTGFPVCVAAQGEQTRPGQAYLAPDGWQMGVESNGRLVLSDEVSEGGLRPSVAYLFRSIARAYGEQAVGVLLTGMGRDGAAELKAMRDRGAVTIAQDEESSLVYGMPGEAVSLGGATHVLHLDRIPEMLIHLATGTKNAP